MSEQTRGMDVEGLIGARVNSLKEYAPEPLDEIAVRLGLPVGQLIKLDANENPYGPTRHVLDALSGYQLYHRYPDPISRRLRSAIGDYLGADPACIMVGNGSDELIDVILRLFRPGPKGRGGIGEVIDCPPTFGMYNFYGATNDMKVVVLPRDADFFLDVDAIEALCRSNERPRILFVSSPNNPDGQLLPRDALDRLLALPLVVVLDEAYVDFSGGSCVDAVPEHDNLIVLRTFSKWAGLAGTRVGYGVFPEALMPSLWKLKSPYNVNGVAQAAALATLEQVKAAEETVAKIVAERERLLVALREIPFFSVYDSQANFLLCRVRGISIEAIRDAMEARGIILRYFDRAGLEDHVRITVGTPMQDEAVLMVLRGLAR